jgi:ABC-type uncharacterized transport system fused permease/ATPase subunit
VIHIKLLKSQKSMLPGASEHMIAKTGSLPSTRTQTHPIREFSRAIGAAVERFRLLSIFLALVVVISVTAVVQLRLNAWNEPFYDSLERKDVGAFIHQLAVKPQQVVLG